MLSLGIFFIQGVHDGLQVLLVAQEISIGSIYKEGLQVVLLYVVGVSFLDAKQVIIRDIQLVGAVALTDVLLQLGHGCVQVNYDLGLYELLQDDIEQALVEAVLVIGKIHLGKQEALGKQVIGDGYALKEVFLLDQLLELLKALGHEEQLQREGKLLGVFVKLRQERIIGKLLQDEPGIVLFGQQVCQRRLPGTNVSLNRYKIILHRLYQFLVAGGKVNE